MVGTRLADSNSLNFEFDDGDLVPCDLLSFQSKGTIFDLLLNEPWTKQKREKGLLIREGKDVIAPASNKRGKKISPWISLIQGSKILLPFHVKGMFYGNQTLPYKVNRKFIAMETTKKVAYSYFISL